MGLFDDIKAPPSSIDVLLRPKIKKSIVRVSTPRVPELSASDVMHSDTISTHDDNVMATDKQTITKTTQDKISTATETTHDKTVHASAGTELTQDKSVPNNLALEAANDETVIDAFTLTSVFPKFIPAVHGRFDGNFSLEGNLDQNSSIPVANEQKYSSILDSPENIDNGDTVASQDENVPAVDSIATITSYDKNITDTKSSYDNTVQYSSDTETSYIEIVNDFELIEEAPQSAVINISSQDKSVSESNVHEETLKGAEHHKDSVTELTYDGITRLINAVAPKMGELVRQSKDENINIDTGSPTKKFKNELLFPLEDNSPHVILLKTNFTKCPERFSYNLRNLSKAARVLYRYLFRLSYGWNKNTTSIPVSFTHLWNKLGYSKLTSSNCFKELEQIGLIEKGLYQANRGNVFKVFYYDENGNLTERPIENKFFCLDNNFFETLKTLTKSEQDVYVYLYEQSYGQNCNITRQYISTTGDISKAIELSPRRVLDALRGLIEKNFIRRLDHNADLYYKYRVFLAHEVLETDNRPQIEIRSGQTATYLTQDVISTPVSSYDKNPDETNFTSHDEKRSPVKDINFQNVTTITKTSHDESVGKETETIIKTSSEQDDDVFNFFTNEFKKYSSVPFTISKVRISDLVKMHGTEKLKSVFEKMIPLLTREGVANPVGLFLHALDNPDDYASLKKPTPQELADKRRHETALEAREKNFTDEVKRIIETKKEGFWNTLNEQDREQAVARRREEVDKGGLFRIPESVLKQTVMERLFWERQNQVWQSLPPEERTKRTGNAKQSIIKRVYAGEDRAIPEPLPDREFLKSVDDYAEKLAMIALGKGGQ